MTAQSGSSTAETVKTPLSPWSPFGHQAFALLWTATLISNIGTWMHDVGAGWLMTSLDPSPAIVSLVQAATSLPGFLFVLFAGALADRIDKRCLLINVNAALVFVIGALAALVYVERVTPTILVGFTFVIGTATAFIAPAWQAIVPSLVPKEKLQPAIALNSMGINISRAIGPAVGGFLIATIGKSAPFVLNALSCVIIVGALLLWRPASSPTTSLPPEPYFGSILTGIRHASRNQPLKATILRALAFFTFASAYWSMLPLVARAVPSGGAEFYGLMLTSIGAGAVGGALALPTIRKRFSSNQVATFATIATSFAMAVMAIAEQQSVIILAALLGGIAWIAMLTSLNVSAQTSLSDWVRARGLALYLMVFSGSMAGGSILWGQVANATSVATALVAASFGILIALFFARNIALDQGETIDHTPAMAWPEPTPSVTVNSDRGPVIVTVEYVVDESDEPAFLDVAYRASAERFRNGASDWGIYQDSDTPRRWLEWFSLSSWSEHLRQHERVSKSEQDVLDQLHRFHRGDDPPIVRHLLAPERESNS